MITVSPPLRGALAAAMITVLLSPSSPAIERRRGYVRQTQVLTCMNRCDFFHLEPDSGYSFIYLRADPNSTVNLFTYLDTHVEVSGFRSGCGGCADFYVSTIFVLSLAGVADDQRTPSAPLLGQNYPNPFNPATTIEYVLAREASVSLKVVDLLGREVSNLAAPTQPPGRHRFVWDASGRPSGVYFYRLLASGEKGEVLIQTKAMMLLR